MERFRYELGFIGAGNMARALIKGILASDLYKRDKIIVSDRLKDAMDLVYKEFSINTTDSNQNLAQISKVILLCVKPQNIKEVLEDIKDVIDSDQLIISIAAGISINTISKTLKKDIPIIRVMPNTAAIVQKGISGICYGPNVKGEHINIALDIFNSVGETMIVKEDMIDLITAVSGSGPGFVFRLMEAMVEAAVIIGANRDDAKKLVVQTFFGASSLAKETSQPLSELREMVTSPKGTTEAGLRVLNEGIDELIYKTIYAAYKRAVEIKKQWER